MAFRISFFKTPKHRVFTYRPLYYDPEKEERAERAAKLRAIREAEKRKKGILLTPTPSETDPRTREERLYYPGKSIRGSFQRALYENRRHAGDNRLVRMAVILSIAVLLIAVLYFANGLGVMFKLLSNTP